MKKVILGAALASACVLGSSTAFAAGGTASGFFIGVDGGYSNVNITKSDLNYTSAASLKDSGLAFGIHTGYMFDQYIGLQLSVNKYQPVKVSEGAFSDEADPYNASLSLLFSYPIYKGFAVYGQAGIGGTLVYHKHKEANANNNDSDGGIKVEPQFGGGLEYTIDKHFTVSAGYNWTRMTININNVDHNYNINYYNLGLTYTF